MFTRCPEGIVILAFPTCALGTKAVFLSGMLTQRDCNWECSMTGCLRPFSEEAPILDLLHDYACSKIVIPCDGFSCQKGGHLPNCFSLKSILPFIRQPLVNTLSVCRLRFGNKHAIPMTNVATPNNLIKQPKKHHSNKFIFNNKFIFDLFPGRKPG